MLYRYVLHIDSNLPGVTNSVVDLAFPASATVATEAAQLHVRCILSYFDEQVPLLLPRQPG